MRELVRAGERTHYLDGPTKVGVVELGGGDVCLVDAGDEETARVLEALVDARGWRIVAVYVTHAHADHVGGLRYLQERTGCKAYAPGVEAALAFAPELEAALLYGGLPPAQLRRPYLRAQASEVESLTAAVLPAALEVVPLPGHSPAMVGYRTADGVVFLADCLVGARTLAGYRVVFLHDVAAQLRTLERVARMEGRLFVPAHAPATADPGPLARANAEAVQGVAQDILGLCERPVTTEALQRALMAPCAIPRTFEHHALVGHTLRSYLTWLQDEGRIEALLDDGRWLWRRT